MRFSSKMVFFASLAVLGTIHLRGPVLGYPASMPVQLDCPGCEGDSDSGTSGTPALNCSTSASVSISVTLGNGQCIDPQPPLAGDCQQLFPCEAIITRDWDNLPADTDVPYCLLIPGDIRRCLDPPPSSGSSGSGSNTRMTNIPCGLLNMKFSVQSDVCAIVAVAKVSCAECGN